MVALGLTMLNWLRNKHANQVKTKDGLLIWCKVFVEVPGKIVVNKIYRPGIYQWE